MRIPFALLLLAGLIAGTIAVQAASADTSCAATFTMLSASARSHGIPSDAFDHMAAIAARHGGAVSLTDVADARDMSLPELQAKVVNCHARYEGKGGDLRVASS